MAPFYKFDYFGEETGFIIALLLGISFGFWLERAGFGYSRKLALQFYFRDMTVLKVMFTAIVVAMVGLTYFTLFGWIDITAVYINPTYLWAQVIGGLVLGIGFAIGGYCPGTSVVGAVTGRIDAYVFLGGALFGMFVFGEMFPWIEELFLAGDMGNIRLPELFNLSTGVVVFLAVLMAVGMFLGGEWLERKYREEKA
ncbi:MAG: sulfurtransferase [Calditrichaeota bacterium]|nr:MAG: sulfurtransferase [Calditrichota bacterium]MBL1206388.1 sulfurtransferase [Calditrichota bacterium]NOG46214.1 YeeE/YedE family protein [Calditrichota bacterium]